MEKTNSKINKINLPALVGKGYKKFWHFKGRYRVVKGSRASKKSKTMALWSIVNIMKYPDANLLVVRNVANTLKNSCFTELKWAIARLKVQAYWRITENPLEMTYIPTGQKIYFRGLDDPLKVTSITVEVGCLCWCWIEEAYEIMNEEDFDMLDESIRGQVPDGLFKQITLTFNPWNEMHWLKHRFFDTVSDDILAITTNYLCNEWLDDKDLRLFEDMKKNRPKRYEVAGLGNWGITDGVIFDNWSVEDLSIKKKSFNNFYNGLDFGFAEDPNAYIRFHVDMKRKRIYITDEFYKCRMQNDELALILMKKMKDYEFVTCDSADPKSIDDLCRRGIRAIPSVKGPNSILFGIQFLQGFDIIIDCKCVNFIKEISNYQWQKDKFGNILQKPVDRLNHLLDALRYGSEPLQFDSKISSTKRL